MSLDLFFQNEKVIGTIQFLACLTGVITNWSVVFLFSKIPSLRSAFGVISAHQAFSEGTYCLVELIYMVPMMLSGDPTLIKYSYHCGFLMYVCYDLSAQSHLLCSINRFCALHFPAKYQNLFTKYHTLSYLIFIWISMSSMSITVFQFLGCHMFYENTVWIYTRTPECKQYTFIIDFCVHITIVGIMIVLNALTFYNFRQRNKSLDGLGNKMASDKRAKSERNFLKQMFFQGSVYVFALLSFFFIASYITEGFLRFFIVILPWILVHSFDGSVTIICNPGLRKLCVQKWKLCFAEPVPQSTMPVIKTMEISRKSRKV